MAISSREWERAVKLLSDADEVVLACHVDPDGDALGSMVAMQRFLAKRGVHTATGWGGSDTSSEDAGGDAGLVVPPQYTFLPGLADLTPIPELPHAPQLFVAFDTGSPERLGHLQPLAERAAHVIVVDHHASGSAFGDVQLVDGEAAATAVLVDELIRRMGGELDREMAECLYVALVTDTGRFQHPSTTPEVMELAARLLSHGIDQTAINRRVWETHSFGYLKVLGRALQRARLVPEAGLIWTAVYADDLAELGVTLAETEGLIDVLRGVEAATCVCVAKELPAEEDPGGAGEAAGGRAPRWKVTLRSKGTLDAGRVATGFGGGGHANAAGFTARGSLEELIGQLVEELRAGAQTHGQGG